MGIINSNAKLLLEAKQTGVCFDNILTIGHLTLFLSKRQQRALKKHYNVKIPSLPFSENEYADNFFKKFLDAKSVRSLDYSNYESCDIVHDMNQPIPSEYYRQFDVVIDGGSLEHIFNFPVAIANCMKVVKTGGSIFIFSMANNHLGHGFYQFSPELFFRIFQPENGFEIREVILEEHPFPGAELSSRTRCYSVQDPATVQKRVGLVNKRPVLIMVHAVRTSEKSIFVKFPIQSDYASIYTNLNNAPETNLIKFLKYISQILPRNVKNYLIGKYMRLQFSFFNKRFYKKWHPIKKIHYRT